MTKNNADTPANTPRELPITVWPQGPAPYEVSGNLAIKAAELGLEDNFRQLEEDGYTVIKDAAPPEFFERLRSTILKKNKEEKANGTVYMTIGKDPVFNEAILNPKLLAVAEYLCGAGFIAYQQTGSVRPKGVPGLFLHTDISANNFRVPYPEHNYMFTACWACDEFTAESGATKVVPGSHKLRRPPTAEEIANAPAIPIECPAGSLAIWSGTVWHGNLPRTIDGERVALHSSYCHTALRPIEMYDHLGEDFLEEWGPTMRTLLRRDPGLLESRREGFSEMLVVPPPLES